MGMYTKFNVILPIKRNTPTIIKEIIIDIIDNGEEKINCGELKKPNHKFFNSDYFAPHNNSFYFTGTSNTKIKYCSVINKNNEFVLHIDCDFKNYDDNINNFLDFIAPYVKSNYEPRFLGYSLYEECINPILYYLTPNNKIISFQTNDINEY
jgi:hypothetical protein